MEPSIGWNSQYLPGFALSFAQTHVRRSPKHQIQSIQRLLSEQGSVIQTGINLHYHELMSGGMIYRNSNGDVLTDAATKECQENSAPFLLEFIREMMTVGYVGVETVITPSGRKSSVRNAMTYSLLCQYVPGYGDIVCPVDDQTNEEISNLRIYVVHPISHESKLTSPIASRLQAHLDYNALIENDLIADYNRSRIWLVQSSAPNPGLDQGVIGNHYGNQGTAAMETDRLMTMERERQIRYADWNKQKDSLSLHPTKQTVLNRESIGATALTIQTSDVMLPMGAKLENVTIPPLRTNIMELKREIDRGDLNAMGIPAEAVFSSRTGGLGNGTENGAQKNVFENMQRQLRSYLCEMLAREYAVLQYTVATKSSRKMLKKTTQLKPVLGKDDYVVTVSLPGTINMSTITQLVELDVITEECLLELLQKRYNLSTTGMRTAKELKKRRSEAMQQSKKQAKTMPEDRSADSTEASNE